MSFGKVANCLLVVLVALANGMPQSGDNTPTQETPDSPPFLQFTNGGIRLNLGGYHAEAGLGGILRGTGGGLHASVGTPWGAHAGAGLGGQLSGEEGSLGGGLYARAGLGRGRPEAGAGIGGSLDGSGRSLNPIAGGMYAGATAGGGPGAGVYLGGGVARDGLVIVDEGVESPRVAARNGGGDTKESATTTTPTSTTARSRTNIQIIRARSKEAKQQQKVTAKTTVLPADEEEKRTRKNEVRRAIPYVPAAAKVAVISAYPAPAAPPAVQTIVEKSVVVPAPAVAVVPAPAENTVTEIARPAYYPRWYFRKRFWSAPWKTVYVGPTATQDTQGASSDTVVGGKAVYVAPAATQSYQGAPSNAMIGGFVGEAAVGGGGGGAVIASKTAYAGGSLFNDIFNIPISTLSAVNQLLNNLG